jgi:hypothetical protein
MAKLSDFYGRVAPYALGVPDSLMEQAVRDACIEFCSTTLLMQQMLDPITVVEGTVEYELSSPVTDTVVTMVSEVWHGTRKLELPIVDNIYPVGAFDVTQADSANSLSWYYHIEPTQILRVFPKPTAAATTYTLTVRAALKPTRTAQTVPDVLYDEWAEAIAASALSKILMLPGQSFSDPKAATFYSMLAAKGMADGLIDTTRAYSRVGMRVSPVRFA